MQYLDNVLVLLAAVVGIHYHIRLLLRCSVTASCRLIRLLCVLALAAVAINETLFVLDIIYSRDFFGLGTALVTASLMALGMMDWGKNNAG